MTTGYLNLDDCWQQERFENGTVFADSTRFPSGNLKALADYVHDRGMLFGTYTDRGTKTCGNRPGSQGYEAVDAQTRCVVGRVDYLEEDSRNGSEDHNVILQQYAQMRDALDATGRPILFSSCESAAWCVPNASLLGNAWRIGPDDQTWERILRDISRVRSSHVIQLY